MGYDLGAPFLSGLYNLTRRGEHCSPAARPEPVQGTARHPFKPCRTASNDWYMFSRRGAHCAPALGEWPEGQEKVLRCVPALR